MITYIALFSALSSRLTAVACDSTRVTSFFIARFLNIHRSGALKRWHGCPSRTVPNAPIRHTRRRTTSSAAKCVSHLCQQMNRRPRYVRPTSLGVLIPFLIGRMFVREPSWEYSANLVGSLLGECLLANLVGSIRRT